MLENMHGKLDKITPFLLDFVLMELDHQQTLGTPCKPFVAMLLLTISMSFKYNSKIIVAWLKDQ